LAQLAGEPGQVLGGSQSSGPVAFGKCLTRRSPSKQERDAPQPRSIPNIKVGSHHSYDGSATVDKIAQPSGKHPYLLAGVVPTLSKVRLSSLEMPRRDLIPEQRVCAGSVTLGAPQVQGATLKFNIGPLQATDLRGSQAMPEGDQDHGAVALAPAVALGSLD
jgi:hypothetical protein